MNILTRISGDRKIQYTSIALLFLIVNTWTYHQHGVKIVNDSYRYLDYANNLHKGFYIDPYNIWYVGYAFYIFVIQSLHSGIEYIIMGQYALGALAVVSLYCTSLNAWKNSFAAWFSCCVFIVFLDIAQWNSYVLTESLYTSFTCFSLYFLSLLYTGRRNYLLYTITILVVIFTFFIKPTGIALLGTVIIVLTFQVVQKLQSRILRLAVQVAACVLTLLLANRMLANYTIMENYQLGEVIYAVTTLPLEPGYHSLVVTPPDNLYVPPPHYPPLLKIIAFVVHHPIYWSQLFFTKAFFLLAHVRPYWSAFHNGYAILFLLSCYFLLVKAMRSEKSNVLFLFALLYLAIHAVSVCLTSEDWDGRFLMPMLPVIMLASGQGFLLLTKKLIEPAAVKSSF